MGPDAEPCSCVWICEEKALMVERGVSGGCDGGGFRLWDSF